MELKEGMYVRTNTAIHKIFKIDENKTVWKYKCDKKDTGEWDGSYEYILIKKEQVLKASFDIIDLLQPGDYVNGKEVLDINIIHKELHINTENDILCIIKERDIKSIVTKERFKSMEYEVE